MCSNLRSSFSLFLVKVLQYDVACGIDTVKAVVGSVEEQNTAQVICVLDKLMVVLAQNMTPIIEYVCLKANVGGFKGRKHCP